MVQALDLYFLTAGNAKPKFAGINSLQSGLDSQELDLAPSACLQGHGLSLKGIHPGKPTDRGLIQHHRLAGFRRCFGQVLKFFPVGEQVSPDLLEVEIFLSTHDRINPISICAGSNYTVLSGFYLPGT